MLDDVGWHKRQGRDDFQHRPKSSLPCLLGHPNRPKPSHPCSFRDADILHVAFYKSSDPKRCATKCSKIIIFQDEFVLSLSFV